MEVEGPLTSAWPVKVSGKSKGQIECGGVYSSSPHPKHEAGHVGSAKLDLCWLRERSRYPVLWFVGPPRMGSPCENVIIQFLTHCLSQTLPVIFSSEPTCRGWDGMGWDARRLLCPLSAHFIRNLLIAMQGSCLHHTFRARHMIWIVRVLQVSGLLK